MLGVVTKTKYTIDRQYKSEYMGTLPQACHCHWRSPTSWRCGSWNPFNRAPVARYTLTSKAFPVFIENIRDVLSEPKFVHEGGRDDPSLNRNRLRSSSFAPADTHRFVFGHSYRIVPSALNRIL